MPAPIVFIDLAGPDEETLREFYHTVFDWPAKGETIFTPGSEANLSMTIRQDPTEKIIYIGVPDITASLAAVEAAGGKIDVPRFEASGGAVVLGLFFDPAGNRMGLVEMEGDTPVVP